MLENLTKLGFTEKEARVYLILLRNGPALASTLAHRTGLKRASVYSILDTLCARGLVSFELTEVGRRYLPHDPECLLYGLEQEKAELQVKWNLARDCVKSLTNPLPMQSMDGRRVIFLKGVKVIQNAISEFMEPTQKLYGLLAEELSGLEKDVFQHLFAPERLLYKEATFLTPPTLLPWATMSVKTHFIEHHSPAHKGHILVQGPKVFFLSQREDIELMLIRDSSYAKTVLEVLIEPYCSNSGVLAESSTISFLKG